LSSELPSSSSDKALTSWKEIARFFDREVRTVQRWEKEEGLPIHRHRHQRQSSVYAYPAELEAWRRERGGQLPEMRVQSTPAAGRRRLLWAVLPAAVALGGLAVWLGAGFSRPSAPAPSFRTAVFEAVTPGGILGFPNMGDVNGDGYDDLVVSNWVARETYVVFGGASAPRGGQFADVANVILRGSGNTHVGVRQLGDFNGDGILDLLVAEMLGEPDSFRATGKNYLLWGKKRWPGKVDVAQMADVTLRLDWPTDARMDPCPAEGAGLDLNGDGIGDLMLGAGEYSFGENKSSGALFVLWGREKWPANLEVASAADLTIRGSRTGEGFGAYCALGDMDGDHSTDLAVFANELTLWRTLGGRGKLYVFYGRESWPRVLDAGSDADFTVAGILPNNGSTQPFLADFNGDGHHDLVLAWMGSPEEGRKDPGEIQIWLGGKKRKGSVSAEAADVAMTGPQPGTLFGYGLAVRDFDADGMADLAVTAPLSGRIYLLYGRKEWKKRGGWNEYAPLTVFRGEAGAGMGGIATADLDGDQLPELAFTSGNPTEGNRAESRRAWVLKPYVPVALDVRPDKEQNVVLWPGVCVARVRPLSPARDEIDPATLRLAGAPAAQWQAKDFDGDGLREWQASFDTGAMRIGLRTKVVAVTARTRHGLPAGGADVVTVIPQDSAGDSGKSPAGANP